MSMGEKRPIRETAWLVVVLAVVVFGLWAIFQPDPADAAKAVPPPVAVIPSTWTHIPVQERSGFLAHLQDVLVTKTRLADGHEYIITLASASQDAGVDVKHAEGCTACKEAAKK